jgi:predicted 2-oxoglutarate/Fe(II)-dependent dioxygenase YbiX
MLSKPDDDFTGGVFETSARPVPLSIGDAVAVTASSSHRVTPVRSGDRVVLVAFGSWNEWNP